MSDLEETFAHIIRCQGNHFPQPVREYQFIAGRKFRFDFAWVEQKVAVELEGRTYGSKCQTCGKITAGGRHTRGAGFEADCEKYALAAIAGWTVLRATAKHLDDLSCLRWLEQALHGKAA